MPLQSFVAAALTDGRWRLSAAGNTKADIGFSIQYLLNCGAKVCLPSNGLPAASPPTPISSHVRSTQLGPHQISNPVRVVCPQIAGSCHGGSAVGTYYFIKSNGFVPFDTCLAYESCRRGGGGGGGEHTHV